MKSFSILLIILLFLTGCSTFQSDPTAVPTNDPIEKITLKISGSGGTTPIIAALAPDFEVAHDNYEIETLTGTGTGGGVQGVIEEVLDVAAMGRAASNEEMQTIRYVSLGFGGEIPIIHAELEINDLTVGELQGIFSGNIQNWSEVGGIDLPIIVYIRGLDSTHTTVIREHFLEDIEFVESAQVMGGMGDMVRVVAGTPGGIGYVNWPTAAALDADVKMITVDGIGATDDGYPALLEIGIGFLPQREDEIKPFVDWLLSDTGQMKLREFGVFPSNLDA